MKEISVIVVTYNSSYEKLKNTLQSIIWQENVDLEIVIADDGSKNFDREKVEKWFSSKGFKDYKLVLNEKNQGTMKNYISGWKAAEGKYVKELSPGDFLYNKNTLERAVRHMEEHNLGIAFGLAASYKKDSENIELLDIMNPRDLRPYYLGNSEWIKFNYVVNRDYANGAAVIERRDLMLKYSGYLEGKVKYMEDCTFILMIADDVPVEFTKDYMIWYECGDGISTKNDGESNQKVFNDNLACFKIIGDMKKEYKFIGKTMVSNKDNVFIKLLKKLNFKMHYIIMQKSIMDKKSEITVQQFRPKIKYLKAIFEQI